MAKAKASAGNKQCPVCKMEQPAANQHCVGCKAVFDDSPKGATGLTLDPIQEVIDNPVELNDAQKAAIKAAATGSDGENGEETDAKT